jgi:hypothetical protein
MSRPTLYRYLSQRAKVGRAVQVSQGVKSRGVVFRDLRMIL